MKQRCGCSLRATIPIYGEAMLIERNNEIIRVPSLRGTKQSFIMANTILMEKDCFVPCNDDFVPWSVTQEINLCNVALNCFGYCFSHSSYMKLFINTFNVSAHSFKSYFALCSNHLITHATYHK